jgi:hypothetical protein
MIRSPNSQPCLCGADDCPKCFPQRTKNMGRYRDDDYDSDNLDDCDYRTQALRWGGMDSETTY